MEKPQMKQEVAIYFVSGSLICFDGTQEAADDFAEFGFVYPALSRSSRYTLSVDLRYDIAEVADYIRAYSRQQSTPPEWMSNTPPDSSVDGA